MRDRIERLRTMPVVEAVAAVGTGMLVVGVAVTVAALIDAARSTPSASLMSWHDRLLLGLWEFRVNDAVWFTAGLLALWWALAAGSRMNGWSETVARLAAGLAVGYALVAAAMVVASTVVALRGSVGDGIAQVTFSDRERLLIWLLQLTTATATALVWSMLSLRMSDAAELPVAPPEPEPDEDWRGLEPVEPDPAAMPKPVPMPDPAPYVPPDPTPPPPSPTPMAPGERAARIFQDRLAYSPRRNEARVLLDRIAIAEREGRHDEAAELVEQLARL